MATEAILIAETIIALTNAWKSHKDASKIKAEDIKIIVDTTERKVAMMKASILPKVEEH
jgi:hypothetical protein